MNFEKHKKAQEAARSVLKLLPEFIDSASTEESISNAAVELLKRHGVTDTWYYGVHAFVLLGTRSCLSVSGRSYKPSRDPIGETNLITVDLSPEIDGCWGDYARSFVVEGGEVTISPQGNEFRAGVNAQKTLHSEMKAFVSPYTTFDELFEFGNALITSNGYVNLDFLGNLGHSIVSHKDDRSYIEKGCKKKLNEVSFFTFEPHVKQQDGLWGFKHENIYYFNEHGLIAEL